MLQICNSCQEIEKIIKNENTFEKKVILSLNANVFKNKEVINVLRRSYRGFIDNFYEGKFGDMRNKNKQNSIKYSLISKGFKIV